MECDTLDDSSLVDHGKTTLSNRLLEMTGTIETDADKGAPLDALQVLTSTLFRHMTSQSLISLCEHTLYTYIHAIYHSNIYSLVVSLTNTV